MSLLQYKRNLAYIIAMQTKRSLLLNSVLIKTEMEWKLHIPSYSNWLVYLKSELSDLVSCYKPKIMLIHRKKMFRAFVSYIMLNMDIFLVKSQFFLREVSKWIFYTILTCELKLKKQPWHLEHILKFLGGSDGKASASNEGDGGLIPESGRSPRERNGNPLQCPCLENPISRGVW